MSLKKIISGTFAPLFLASNLYAANLKSKVSNYNLQNEFNIQNNKKIEYSLTEYRNKPFNISLLTDDYIITNENYKTIDTEIFKDSYYYKKYERESRFCGRRIAFFTIGTIFELVGLGLLIGWLNGGKKELGYASLLIGGSGALVALMGASEKCR